jgi:outer membrane protein OmpA-like peptidoglycan-associated protein
VPEVNIRIPSQVVFDFGSAALRPESRAFLRRVARLLHHATTRVRVAGYTDNVGTPAFNRRLSLRRAQAVRRFLIHPGGVRVRLLRAVGFGEAHPLASNATELGRQRNRRVIISFHLASTYGFRL